MTQDPQPAPEPADGSRLPRQTTWGRRPMLQARRTTMTSVAAVAPGELRGDALGDALADGSGVVGSGSDGIGSGWQWRERRRRERHVGLGVGVGGGVGTGVGTGVGGGVGTGDGVTAGPATTTIGGTPRSAPLPLHPWSR